MPSVAHYRGDVTASLTDMSVNGHLFGPDACGPRRHGEVLGQGAHYELVEAVYDPEHVWPDGTTGRTTATFRPYVPPHQRARVRYYGSDGDGNLVETDPPDEVGTPKLADRDDIRRR